MVLRNGVSVLKPLVRSTGPCKASSRPGAAPGRVGECVLKPLVRSSRPAEAPGRWYSQFISFSSGKG